MRIAVVGSGVSGLVVAHRLWREHELELFEAGAHVGGHVHTHELELEGRRLAVDTGFIVFNRRTYPGFCALLEELGVGARPSDMSFGVRCERSGLEYAGSSLDTLFAQRRNLARPAFWRMLRDLVRFYREARELLAPAAAGADDPTLGEWLARKGYGPELARDHLVPMASAVWSSRPDALLEFPARWMVRFFDNHGFLELGKRPQWLTVEGGSRSYVERLIAPFRERVHLRTPVVGLRRTRERVELELAGGERLAFDEVVLALHADQALAVLRDPSPLERELLGSFPYQENEAVLHTDGSLLPRNPRARASWNAHLLDPPAPVATVTYWMNRLQSLPVRTPVCVTLNRGEAVDPARVLARMRYHHPVYSHAAERAQARWSELSGARHTHYCGAYWGFGFHEDGLRSAERVVASLRARESLRASTGVGA